MNNLMKMREAYSINPYSFKKNIISKDEDNNIKGKAKYL